MLDTTSYSDKLPESLNQALKSFTGGECVMVRKIKDKDKDKLKTKTRNCHLNVKNYIDAHGGSSVSGWLLQRYPLFNERGGYTWSFHSVWQKPDGKLVDVTDDVNYEGRDKSIFVPDSTRVPDLVEGLSYNNFMVFTEAAFAAHYGNTIGKQIEINTVYWSDEAGIRLMDVERHSGVYRLLAPQYTENYKRLCDEYDLEIINGKLSPVKGGKYDGADGLPIEVIFDYALKIR